MHSQWPGYESYNRQVNHPLYKILYLYCNVAIQQIKTHTCHNDPRPITLAKLGSEVAKSLKMFIEVSGLSYRSPFETSLFYLAGKTG
jgi:hypothetical protein